MADINVFKLASNGRVSFRTSTIVRRVSGMLCSTRLRCGTLDLDCQMANDDGITAYAEIVEDIGHRVLHAEQCLSLWNEDNRQSLLSLIHI